MKAPSLRDRYKIEALSSSHNRKSFTCRDPTLDRYIQQQASQDAKRNVAAVFVAVESSSGSMHGFYSLSMASVPLSLLPKELAQKMPRYPSVPAVRLGRLAVRRDVQGNGLGTHMLLDAMSRALKSEIAWVAFIVDAKDEQAKKWYRNLGFSCFPDNKRHLYLMRKTIEALRLG